MRLRKPGKRDENSSRHQRARLRYFFSGPPAEILKAWRDSLFQIVLSPQILEEYREVSSALGKNYPGGDIQPIIDLLMVHGEMVLAEDSPEPVCDDQDDDKFFECAMAGACAIIVSGDKHLLKVSGYGGITVLKPREFVELHVKKR